MLKDHAEYLLSMHPDLALQIQAGLILAILGRVKPTGDYSEELTNTWQVLGETYEPNPETGKVNCRVYTIRDLQTVPRRWDCNCEQGKSYGPLAADFLNRPGRICKHIAAVAIAWLAPAYPEKPGNVFEMVSRLVAEQAVFLVAGDSHPLPTPYHIKIEYYDKNGQSGLCLKTGRVRSEILAQWLPMAGDAGQRCEWQMVEAAESRYQLFKSKIEGTKK